MKDSGLDKLFIFVAEKLVKNYKNGSQKVLNELKTGITVDQWVVLKLISENKGANQVDVAKSSAKDAPTTTRIIDQLVRKKLVLRLPDPLDRRKFKLQTTEAGNKLVKMVIPEIMKHRKHVLKAVTEKEVEQLMKTMNKMLKQLD